jgi:hypothetical protein
LIESDSFNKRYYNGSRLIIHEPSQKSRREGRGLGKF